MTTAAAQSSNPIVNVPEFFFNSFFFIEAGWNHVPLLYKWEVSITAGLNSRALLDTGDGEESDWNCRRTVRKSEHNVLPTFADILRKIDWVTFSQPICNWIQYKSHWMKIIFQESEKDRKICRNNKILYIIHLPAFFMVSDLDTL